MDKLTRPNILDARKPCPWLLCRGQEIVNPNLDYIRRRHIRRQIHHNT